MRLALTTRRCVHSFAVFLTEVEQRYSLTATLSAAQLEVLLCAPAVATTDAVCVLTCMGCLLGVPCCCHGSHHGMAQQEGHPWLPAQLCGDRRLPHYCVRGRCVGGLPPGPWHGDVTFVSRGVMSAHASLMAQAHLRACILRQGPRGRRTHRIQANFAWCWCVHVSCCWPAWACSICNHCLQPDTRHVDGSMIDVNTSP